MSLIESLVLLFFAGSHCRTDKWSALPVFAKAGAIIPMQNAYVLEPGNDLDVVIFPGKSNRFMLYEDAGDGSEFENGEFVKTEMTLEWSENPVFTVKPAAGALSLLPETRNYQFILRGFHENISVTALVDGKEVASAATYDSDTFSMIFNVAASTASEIKLVIFGETLITDNGDALMRCSNLMQKACFDIATKSEVMKILKDPELPLRRKIKKINFRCAKSMEHQDLIEALTEQLTLIEL